MRTTALLLAVLVFASPGCAWYRAKIGGRPDPEKVSKIVAGQTTRQEVDTLLGAPDAVARLGSGDVYLYRYDEGKAFLLFLLLVNWGNLDLKPDRLLVAFDSNGLVTNVAYRSDSPKAEFRLKP